MLALALTAVFSAATMIALFAMIATVRRYGASALALREQLAAAPSVRTVTWKTIEHRHLRGDVNVVILPIRKADYRRDGLRAAA